MFLWPVVEYIFSDSGSPIYSTFQLHALQTCIQLFFSGYTFDEVQKVKMPNSSEHSCTKKLLEDWATHPTSTVGKLITALSHIDRSDLVHKMKESMDTSISDVQGVKPKMHTSSSESDSKILRQSNLNDKYNDKVVEEKENSEGQHFTINLEKTCSSTEIPALEGKDETECTLNSTSGRCISENDFCACKFSHEDLNKAPISFATIEKGNSKPLLQTKSKVLDVSTVCETEKRLKVVLDHFDNDQNNGCLVRHTAVLKDPCVISSDTSETILPLSTPTVHSANSPNRNSSIEYGVSNTDQFYNNLESICKSKQDNEISWVGDVQDIDTTCSTTDSKANPLKASQSVTATTINPLKASQAVTATTIDPLKASQAVTATTIYPLKASQAVTATTINPLKASQAVTVTTIDPGSTRTTLQTLVVPGPPPTVNTLTTEEPSRKVDPNNKPAGTSATHCADGVDQLHENSLSRYQPTWDSLDFVDIHGHDNISKHIGRELQHHNKVSSNLERHTSSGNLNSVDKNKRCGTDIETTVEDKNKLCGTDIQTTVEERSASMASAINMSINEISDAAGLFPDETPMKRNQNSWMESLEARNTAISPTFTKTNTTIPKTTRFSNGLEFCPDETFLKQDHESWNVSIAAHNEAMGATQLSGCETDKNNTTSQNVSNISDSASRHEEEHQEVETSQRPNNFTRYLMNFSCQNYVVLFFGSLILAFGVYKKLQ